MENLSVLSFYLFYPLTFKPLSSVNVGEQGGQLVPALVFPAWYLWKVQNNQCKFLTYCFILLLVHRPPIHPSLTVLGK